MKTYITFRATLCDVGTDNNIAIVSWPQKVNLEGTMCDDPNFLSQWESLSCLFLYIFASSILLRYRTWMCFSMKVSNLKSGLKNLIRDTSKCCIPFGLFVTITGMTFHCVATDSGSCCEVKKRDIWFRSLASNRIVVGDVLYEKRERHSCFASCA